METDSQLVARSRAGDIAAFQAIVDRHRAALIALAAARLGCPTRRSSAPDADAVGVRRWRRVGGLSFDAQAARISGLALRERRRRDCRVNAAQYGCRLDDLDWDLCDTSVLCGALGQAAG